MAGFVKNTVAKRLTGDRPSVMRALLVAILIGIVAAVITYRLMRMRG
jgi:hypothetical protein